MSHVEMLSVSMSAQFRNMLEKSWTASTFHGVSSTSVSLVLANMPERSMALEVFQVRMSLSEVSARRAVEHVGEVGDVGDAPVAHRKERPVSELVPLKAPDMFVMLEVSSQNSMPPSVVRLLSPLKRSLMECSVSPQVSMPVTPVRSRRRPIEQRASTEWSVAVMRGRGRHHRSQRGQTCRP